MTMKYSLYSTAMLAFGLFASHCAANSHADLIISGGNIITIDSSQPNAEAVAVKDGVIHAVGNMDSIRKLQGPTTQYIDLDGKTLIPGFIDGHGHVFNTGIQALSANLLAPPDGSVTDIKSLQLALKSWAQQQKNDTGLVMGFGYDDSQLQEKRHPTAQELDEVFAQRPVVIVHQSGHLGTLNSAALKLVGINAQSEDPKGGKIRRESDGKTPNGVLEETAFFTTLMKLMSGLNEQDNEDVLQAGMDLYASFGYTTAQEGRASVDAIKTMYTMAQKQKLPVDIAAYPDIEFARDVISAPYLSRNYNNGFRVAGAKLNLDGSPQGKTAWLSEPYLVPPEGLDKQYRGYPSMADDKAFALIELAHSNGWQLLTHVNGDAAIDQLIRGVAKSEAKHGKPDRGFIAIHAQTARKDQVKQFKELGIFPSFFPMHTFYWGDWHVDSVLGQPRADNISPTGWARELGMKYTSHHDAPVALPDSMRVYSATVNRVSRSGKVIGTQHKVTPLDGLKAQTLWAAYQYHEEDSKGSIKEGKLADFVILSDNPLSVAKDTIVDIEVLQTIKEGVVVYRKEQPTQAQSKSCAASAQCSAVASNAMYSSGLLHTHTH